MPRNMPRPSFAKSVPVWMMAGFLLVLWLGGGASRADAAGQIAVRLVGWGLLAATILIAPPFRWRPMRPILILLGACASVVAVQLIPLPPDIWAALPGREIIAEVSRLNGQAQTWRPLSVSPGATVNALGSLVVPLVAVVLAATFERKHHWQIFAFLLGLVVVGAILGLLQVSGARFDNPMINEIAGAVSGNFANRNHFALFLAIGCILAPIWGLHQDRGHKWRAVAAIALVMVFVMIGLATGSRAGLLLCSIGCVAGLAAVHRQARAELSRLPRSYGIGLLAVVVIGFATAITLAVTFDRAASVSRVVDLEAGEDLRRQALPYVLQATAQFFPVGAGFGTFDPVYRTLEPDALLSPRYFNHAHNDWLEIVLDGGLPAALLLLAFVIWWLAASRRAWSAGQGSTALAKAGSSIVLLTLLASVVDYPARTPMIMAVLALACVWLVLARHDGEPRRPS